MLLNLRSAQSQLSEAFAGRDRSSFTSRCPVNILHLTVGPKKIPFLLIISGDSGDVLDWLGLCIRTNFVIGH
jgi:hypothetical protein